MRGLGLRESAIQYGDAEVRGKYALSWKLDEPPRDVPSQGLRRCPQLRHLSQHAKKRESRNNLCLWDGRSQTKETESTSKEDAIEFSLES